MAKSRWTMWWCKSNPFAEDLPENKSVDINSWEYCGEAHHMSRRERTHSPCDYSWTNTGSSFTDSYYLVLGHGGDAFRLVRATKEFSSGV